MIDAAVKALTYVQAERRKLKSLGDTKDEATPGEATSVGPNYALAAKWYHLSILAMCLSY
jgi:hypothetical protein